MSKHKLSTVIAVTALVVAVFGSTPLGRAAQQLVLPKASVGTAQLKKSAVTGAKVKNGTLMAADFKAGQLPAGPRGPQGEIGPQGPPGPVGAPPEGTFTNAITRNGAAVLLDPGKTSDVVALCAAGEVATGGGYSLNPPLEALASLPSVPGGVPGKPATGWRVKVKNPGGVQHLFRPWVICAS